MRPSVGNFFVFFFSTGAIIAPSPLRPSLTGIGDIFRKLLGECHRVDIFGGKHLGKKGVCRFALQEYRSAVLPRTTPKACFRLCLYSFCRQLASRAYTHPVQVSSKSVHNFLVYPAHKLTDKGENTTSIHHWCERGSRPNICNLFTYLESLSMGVFFCLYHKAVSSFIAQGVAVPMMQCPLSVRMAF